MKNIRISQLINDKNNPANNQFVVETNKGKFFQSYDTLICFWDGNNIVLSEDWDYSKTTSKHLYIFIRDFTPYSVYNRKDVLKAIKDNKFKVVEKLSF